MTTTTISHISELSHAIARSISHDEIVRCQLDGITRDEAMDYLDVCDGITEMDYADTRDCEDTPYADIWGTANGCFGRGGDFRLYIYATN